MIFTLPSIKKPFCVDLLYAPDQYYNILKERTQGRQGSKDKNSVWMVHMICIIMHNNLTCIFIICLKCYSQLQHKWRPANPDQYFIVLEELKNGWWDSEQYKYRFVRSFRVTRDILPSQRRGTIWVHEEQPCSKQFSTLFAQKTFFVVQSLFCTLLE